MIDGESDKAKILGIWWENSGGDVVASHFSFCSLIVYGVVSNLLERRNWRADEREVVIQARVWGNFDL